MRPARLASMLLLATFLLPVAAAEDTEMTAMQAAQAADARARAVAADAYLVRVGTEHASPADIADGRLATWMTEFYSPSQHSSIFVLTGTQEPPATRLLGAAPARLEGARWLVDSPSAIAVAAGDDRYRALSGHADAEVVFAVDPGRGGNPFWVVALISAHGSVAVRVDARTGERADIPSFFGPEAAGAVAGAAALSLLAFYWPTLKFGAFVLYSRIAKDRTLDHATRERIYRLIQREPAIHAKEVAARSGVAWGTTIHHLRALTRSGLVTGTRSGRYMRFASTTDERRQFIEAFGLLRNPMARRIANEVAQRPGRNQRDICASLGISSALASWHLRRLVDAQLVAAEAVGRARRYTPGSAWTATQA